MRVVVPALAVLAAWSVCLSSCRSKAAPDPVPPRSVIIKFCWQTFDLGLQSKSDFVQNTTLRTLGRIKNKAAVETIRSVDFQGRRSTVKSAVYTLSQIEDSASFQALVTYAASSDFQVRESVVVGLARMKHLYGDSVVVRILHRMLDEMDSVPADTLMYDAAEILQEKDELRAKIGIGLLSCGQKDGYAYLDRAFAHPQFQLRVGVVRVIGDVRPPEADSYLQRFAHDPIDYVRVKTSEALGKVGGPSAIRLLKEMIRDPDEDVAVEAASAILAADERLAVDRLVDLLASPDDEVRSKAIFALARVRGDENRRRVLAAVRPLLQDPVDLIRMAAAGAVGSLNDTSSVSILEDLMRDRSEDVQEVAVGVCSRMLGPSMIDRLVRLLEHDRYSMREVAVSGLGSIDEPSLQDQILRRIYDRMRNDEEMTVRVRAAFTLLDMLHERVYTRRTSPGEES